MLGWKKEGLAVKVGLNKFHKYLLAINFNHILITNHIWDCSGKNMRHVVNDTI